MVRGDEEDEGKKRRRKRGAQKEGADLDVRCFPLSASGFRGFYSPLSRVRLADHPLSLIIQRTTNSCSSLIYRGG